MTTPEPQYSAPPQYAGAAPSKTLSIISLIAGIVGVVSSFFYIGFLFGVAAVVLGFLGRKREPAAKGFWLTGIILGFVAIALTIVAIIVVIAALSLAASYGTSVQ
ncbi:DUF4190 domain-containing protein [Naasia lichenicola]|uniref:DUF4190 domain-containing protein n=1 Tax=Naasia lichenicola TaxID=2565933 RepID=A0A4S4FIS9_9MICO|nr:DUF4190 domain-containing protein [Naasia lichenicola]THG29752.1 DUF4190 domain-containing protein [Naasia lichenicola]